MPRMLVGLGRRTFIHFATALLVAAHGFAADQAEPWNSPHFSLNPVVLYAAASEGNPPSGSDVAEFVDEDVFVFDADGGCIHTYYEISKVLTQKGVEAWSRTSAGWAPWNEARPSLRARVITPDFAVHELDPKTISDSPLGDNEADVYSDRRVLQAPFPAIAPGSVVEEESVMISKPEFAGSGYISWRIFGPVGVPVQLHRLVIDAPSSLPVQYELRMLPNLKPQRAEENGRVKLVFEYRPAAPLDPAEDYLPRGELSGPAILFSAGTTWQKATDAYAQITDGVLRDAQVKPLVEKLTRGKSSQAGKEEAILTYLDNEIRYTGIEFSENSIIPHATADTLTRKFGDCKDKALLMVAMLRAAGIPSYMALLNTGRGLGILPDLPGIGWFDHAIVYVPGNPGQWIDPTDQYARLGQLPIGDQGKSALIVRSGSQGLVRIPEDTGQVNLMLERREVHLAENGPARVVEITEPGGCFESYYRGIYSDPENKKTRENLTNYVKESYLAERLDRWDRSDPSDLSHTFELTLESDKAKRGITDLENAVVAIRLEDIFSLLPSELQEREPEEDKVTDSTKPKIKRTSDYELEQAAVKEWQYTITPPLGFQPLPLPADAKVQMGPAVFTEHFSADSNGVVHADIRFDTVQRRFTVAEATEMRNKVEEVNHAEPIVIHFEIAGKIFQQQGKMRESFESYRNLIAQHPNEAVHHLQIAQALLEGGMGDAARNEARLAVKLEPDSALAEKSLAFILEYDSVGRRFRPESDYAGAEAAFRAAAKLDPDDKSSIGDLAILLEYNDYGLRYGPGARLQESVAEYRELSAADLANLGLENNLAFTLFYAGEFAESQKYAETLNPQPKDLMVACVAAQNGSEAAIQEAAKLTSGTADQKETLKSAGNLVLRLRKYSLVADLWRAGAGGDSADRTMAQVAIYSKARRHEEIQFQNTPQDVTLKYYLLTMDPEETTEKLNEVISKNSKVVWQNTDPDEIKTILGNGLRMRQKWARDGYFWDVDIDYRLQGTEIQSEGNDAAGYREVVQTPDGGHFTLFVVKEDGQYKVVNLIQSPAPAALEILDRLAANDLTGAKTFLDWLRDYLHLSGGDDPLTGLVFPRMWSKGKEADAAQMRLAAAAILAQSKPTARQGVAILEEARKTSSNDTEITNIDLGLLSGYINLQDPENGLAVSTRLAQHFPESGYAFVQESSALRRLRRYSEAQALAEERLKRIPGDTDALNAFSRDAALQEDYRAAYDWMHKIVEEGKADSPILNDLAWLTLLFERPGGPDIESALKSSQLKENVSSTLHTLGCLYAEVGKATEAHDMLIHAMDLRDLVEPNPDFWYAFGRLAELYGERDIALADYAKVTKPKEWYLVPESTYELAQNHLKILQNSLPQAKP